MAQDANEAAGQPGGAGATPPPAKPGAAPAAGAAPKAGGAPPSPGTPGVERSHVLKNSSGRVLIPDPWANCEKSMKSINQYLPQNGCHIRAQRTEEPQQPSTRWWLEHRQGEGGRRQYRDPLEIGDAESERT
ncbi:hypothetical protein Y032_0102g3479 [Ancylostoma ceylanicum]|uniref:Uncharacterized protein n=1 Tax=Ancylostoma ceylanicum TaxID=53326 RepID=A0A016THH8_9BILA|nr:hypothetical protein Y032_0102g3479 [Ancylostoma ceylanicum]